jgi:hypothetical protein
LCSCSSYIGVGIRIDLAALRLAGQDWHSLVYDGTAIVTEDTGIFSVSSKRLRFRSFTPDGGQAAAPIESSLKLPSTSTFGW